MQVALRLREPYRRGLEEHFGPTDPDPKLELSRFPLVRRFLKSRIFQFLFILPNQIIFWLVIVSGIVGAQLPTRNFSTVITWYIWFCLVFLLMVGVGRGWCLMCPFGGFAEWVQRRTFWKRNTRALTLGRRWSANLSRYGLIPSALVFIVLTWFEEFFNIAGPGVPAYTSYLVIGVISLALVTFLIMERRTFCRYLCPLSALIGTVGSTGMVAGFRTKNRDVCLACSTKDCMRGSENGYGCPWYEWPGSATANLTCGLCSECFKNCPYDNIGLYAQAPLTSVVAPTRRRADIGVVVLALFGLVLFQQVNALPIYTAVDNWLNQTMRFPGYPNPIDYLGIIALFGGVVALYVAALKGLLAKRVPQVVGAPRGEAYLTWLTPLAYGLIPLVGADYLARQLPRFFDHMLRIVPAISNPFALNWNLFGTAHSSLYNVRLLSTAGVVHAQLAVVLLGTAASLYTTLRIVTRDMKALTERQGWLKVLSLLFVLVAGVAVGLLYVAMGGAE